MSRIRARLVLTGLLLAPAVFANGRFPRGQRLVESPTNPKALALYGTYGLIVTSDAGQSWNHVCEAATGIYTGEDPLLEFLPKDELLARTQSSLVRSGDTWCDWSVVRDGKVRQIQDITHAPTEPLKILAIVGSVDPTAGWSSFFTQSSDGGTTWSADQSIPLVARGLSLDVAPSSTSRVFLSGLDASGAGKLLVSDNGGAAWQARALGTTDMNSGPYIAAVSKQDSNRLFVRTDAYETINGIDTGRDALLLSTDAGVTWSTIIQKSAKLYGFALSPDESTLLVGYGDPQFAATYVDPADVGLYRVDMATVLADPANASSHFKKIFDGSVTCLRWTTTALYACAYPSEHGWVVGRAADASFELADANPFTPLLELSKVTPLPCWAGTSGYACYSDPDNGFASVCRTFKTSCDAGTPPPPPAGSRDASADGSSSGGTTNSGGAKAGAGTAGVSAAGAAPAQAGGTAGGGAGGGTDTAGSGTSSSCGCRMPSDASTSSGAAIGAGALSVLLMRRLRRRPNAVSR